jgi:low temperature requirement protein LtrA
MARRQADLERIPGWWGVPKRFAERGGDRKISWLELFYDLVYVAVVSQLTTQLAANPSWSGLAFFSFLFILIFWSWVNGSLYHDLHGNAGVRTRLLTLWQMMAIAAVATTIDDVYLGQHQGFAVCYGLVQLLITYLWWSTGYYDPSHRSLNRVYLFNYSICVLLFALSVVVSYQTALYLWAAALAINLATPILSALYTRSELRNRGEVITMSDSVIERFGLFTIIVLGETVLGIIHGIDDRTDKSPAVWAAFILGILIAFMLWWIYFDILGESHARRGYRYFLFINFMYMPLLTAFAVSGSTIRVMLADTDMTAHSQARFIFGASIAMILGSILALSVFMQSVLDARSARRVRVLLASVMLLVLLITAIADSCSTLLYLALIALTLLTSIIVGMRIWMGAEQAEG